MRISDDIKFVSVSFILLGLTLITTPLLAHQPIMDMAPRWKGGYGFQIRQEHRSSNSLLFGSSKITNPFGREIKKDTTWLEGVYTFTRELRVAVKIPYVKQSRTIVLNNTRVDQSQSGMGDVIVGLLLKRYKNKKSSTGNYAITPSIRLPTGNSSGNFPISDGSTDFGISISKSTEKANFYQYYDLFYWKNGRGKNGFKQGNELGLDINLGLHPYHSNLKNSGIFTMIDISVRHQLKGINFAGATGGTRISMGPVFVWYRQGIMFRAEYKIPVYEKVNNSQVSYGSELNIGIGFAF